MASMSEFEKQHEEGKAARDKKFAEWVYQPGTDKWDQVINELVAKGSMISIQQILRAEEDVARAVTNLAAKCMSYRVAFAMMVETLRRTNAGSPDKLRLLEMFLDESETMCQEAITRGRNHINRKV